MYDKCGIVWIATNEQYYAMALRSLLSARECMPDLQTCLVTDDRRRSGISGFDVIVDHEKPGEGYGDQVTGMGQSPFERTICLDSDTFVTKPLWKLFDLVTLYPVAATHGLWRFSREPCEDLPCVFEWACGMVAFKDCPVWRKFHKHWSNLYFERRRTEGGNPGTQIDFREAILDQTVPIFTLGPSFNFQVGAPGFLGGKEFVHVSHSKKANGGALGLSVNTRQGPRVWKNRELLG